MSNNLVYDTPRLDDITEFLQRIYRIRIDNPTLCLDKNIIYHELCRTGIKKSEVLENGELKSNEEMFEKWYKRFEYNPNVFAFNDPGWPYFFQFVHGNMHNSDEYVKLYIPLDSKHLYEGANILFDYIASLNIDHCSKISKKIRSDNVIVRLRKGDYYNAMKIINFIKSNKYLNEGLNKTNPFVPTICGIGIMDESGISYNSEIAMRIRDYINFCVNRNITNVDAKSFTNWMKENGFNNEVQSIYMDAVGEKNEISYSTSDKVQLVISSLKATFNKYGYYQVYSALCNALKYGDFQSFTNGNSNEPNYRDLMKQSLDSNTLKTIVYSMLEKICNKNVEDLNIEDVARKFCDYLFRNSMVKDLEEACMVTISKISEKQCVDALHNYYYQNIPTYFSRYKPNDPSQKNYRNVVISYDKTSLLQSVKVSLLLRDINIEGLSPDDMFRLYSMELAKSKDFEETKVAKV